MSKLKDKYGCKCTTTPPPCEFCANPKITISVLALKRLEAVVEAARDYNQRDTQGNRDYLRMTLKNREEKTK